MSLQCERKRRLPRRVGLPARLQCRPPVFRPQLGQLGLERAEMVVGGLALLRARARGLGHDALRCECGDAVAERSKQLLLFHVGGLAFCTLFFNGTSSGALLGALGMTKRSEEAAMLLDQHVEKQLALVSMRIFKVRVNDMNVRYRNCGSDWIP